MPKLNSILFNLQVTANLSWPLQQLDLN